MRLWLHNLSDDQMDNWGNGMVLNANSAEEIYELYDLYLHFHTLNDTFYHPDTIIVINEW